MTWSVVLVRRMGQVDGVWICMSENGLGARCCGLGKYLGARCCTVGVGVRSVVAILLRLASARFGNEQHVSGSKPCAWRRGGAPGARGPMELRPPGARAKWRLGEVAAACHRRLARQPTCAACATERRRIAHTLESKMNCNAFARSCHVDPTLHCRRIRPRFYAPRRLDIELSQHPNTNLNLYDRLIRSTRA